MEQVKTDGAGSLKMILEDEEGEDETSFFYG
jgi:hypothetical protein